MQEYSISCSKPLFLSTAVDFHIAVDFNVVVDFSIAADFLAWVWRAERRRKSRR